MAARHPFAGASLNIISVTAHSMIWLLVMAFVAMAGVSTPAQAAKYAANPTTHFALVPTFFQLDILRLPSTLFAAVTKITIRNINAARLERRQDQRPKRLLPLEGSDSNALLQTFRDTNLKDSFRLIGQVVPPLVGNSHSAPIKLFKEVI